MCRIWRMPNYFWRFTWTLFAFMFGLTVIFQSWMGGWKDVKLGIDLRGGTILVYQVKGIGTEGITQEMDSPEASQSKINMEELTVALRRRVDPDSVKDVTIRALGSDQVEIIIPEVDEDEVAMLKRKIASVGTLEFRITANQRDHADIIEIAQQTPGRAVRSADGKETLGWWIPVAAESDTNFAGGGFIWREGKEEGKDILEVLVVNDDFNVQGGYLESATASFDGFNPIVEFRFNAVGASLFRGLTSANQPVPNPQNPNNPFTRQLGIILDGYLQSAPSLQAVISDRGQISGGFTQEKTEELAGILKAGRLPAVLGKVPSSEMTTGPTLGMDTIERAKYAILVSILLIMVIMLYYYRFSGVVAVVSLLLLMMLTFAIMVSINAAFTLPGLAGLVLTVGMAVDANILIYERLREEYLEGNAIGVCVRNGFSKALSAIVDSNLTTLIVASILFWIGTEQIRGFAIILWIGIVISMFSAIYVGRTIFDVAIQRGWLKEIRMHRILPPTHFPFMSYARQTLTVSGILMLLCVVAVFARVKGVGDASSLFDIDFSGGNTVQVLFNDAQTEAGIYDRLADDFQDLTVTDVTLMTDEANNMLFRRYNITTTSPKDKEASVYLEEIQAKLKERFAGELKTNKMTFEVKSNAVAAATPVAPLDATSLENAAPAVETPAPAPAENAAPA
ncbi:MAG: protein translocase subunit SecD, partial [Planctomycetia bacterium]|nr:protein translocase subunit SecD [Planctomycetia bacterium]